MTFPNLFGSEPYSVVDYNFVLGNLHGLDCLRDQNPPADVTSKITAAINCTPDFLKPIPGVEVLNVGRPDGSEMPEDKFHLAIEFARERYAQGETIMVCCHAGISRSPSLLAAIMISIYHYKQIEHVLDYIKTKRDIIQPSNTVVRGMKKLLKLWPYGDGYV